MKAFFISTAIFFSMIAVVIYNYMYINKTADRLEEIVSAVSDNSEDGIAMLEDFWKKNNTKLDFTVNHQIVSSIEKKIGNIRLFADSDDDRQLEKELFLLSEDIKELRRSERFSLDNIF